MRVKVPKRMTQGALSYSIKIEPNLLAHRHCAGFIDPIKQEIQVDNHLPPDERVVTLCHEVTHFIERVFSIDISDSDADRLAQGWASFLRDCNIEFDWSLIQEK